MGKDKNNIQEAPVMDLEKKKVDGLYIIDDFI